MPQLQIEPKKEITEPNLAYLEVGSLSPLESVEKLVARAGLNYFSRKDDMVDKRKLAYLEKAGGSWANIKNIDKVQKKLRANDLKNTRRMRERTF